MTGKYYIEGLDCADCARKFAENVALLPGVKKAEVNFAAATLTIEGDAPAADLDRLAKEEGFVLFQEKPVKKKGGGNKNLAGIAVVGGIALACGLLLIGLVENPWWGKSFLLFAILVGGGSTFLKAVRNLKHFRFDMSVLMTVAVIGALLIGEWKEAAIVAWLFAMSAWLESYTAGTARNALAKLMENVPELAILVTPEGEKEVPAAEVKVGQRLLVRAGQKIPVDGLVVAGFSHVSEAAITGEATPLEKTAGSHVLSGSINEMGSLTIEVEKTVANSTMAQIVKLVEAAQNKEVTYQTFVNRFAAVYTPIVIVLAGFLAVLPPLLFSAEWQTWIYNGLALLVVACPCALVITTPVVLVAALGNAAKNGVIIKGGTELEKLAAATIALFDKTGTLTCGKHSLVGMMAFWGSEEEVLMKAAAVERYSQHPLALAIYQAAKDRNVAIKEAGDFRLIAGQGAEAILEGRLLRVGKPTIQLPEKIASQWQKWENQGMAVVALEEDGSLLGILALSDTVRQEAAAALAELRPQEIKPLVMLTGDNAMAAKYIAEMIGIDQVEAGLLPEDKLRLVEEYKKKGSVLMVGDGINDAPALAAADISVAMGAAGSDTALEAADIALMSDDLMKIPYAIRLSRRALKVIRQNITFAIALKVLVFLAIFPGWLTLWLAIVADMGANILVTLNGMRLADFSVGKKRINEKAIGID